MASISKLQKTKDGKRFWRIYVSRGKGNGTYTMRFYWPVNEKTGRPYSENAALNQLNKAAVDFENSCKAGLHLNRQEKKEQEEKERLEAEKRRLEEEKIKTFMQYAEKVYMPVKEVTTAENSRAYYQNALTNHLYSEFGDNKLTEITSAQISAYLLELQSSDLSYSTVTGIYRTLKQLLTMAYQDESIDRNPMDRVQPPRKRKEEKQKEIEYLSADQLKQVIKWLDDEPMKWQVYIRFSIETGARRGEVCALKWEDIDFETNTVTIKGNLSYTKEKGVYLSTPKTGESRNVPISDSLSKLLEKYKTQQEEDRKKRIKRLAKDGKALDFNKVSESEYVFTEKGYISPMHPQSPNRFFKKFSDKHGVDIHPHMLRHSYASVSITQGADIASVSEVLGHADKSTTLRMYTHADEESKRRASEIMYAAIGLG